MPTIITHAAVPLCIGFGLGKRNIPSSLIVAGIALAMLPDIDVLSFKFNIPYGDVFGHRGWTHSLLFAFVVPVLCVNLLRGWFKAGWLRCWLFLTVSLLSHSLLDSITKGGVGVAWLWPYSPERFLAPPNWQVIPAAPFSIASYASDYGQSVMMAEFTWIWLPALILMMVFSRR